MAQEVGTECVASFCGCNEDGIFCCRFQNIADDIPDAFNDNESTMDSNSESEDDTDDM